jgi:osmotically inducible protein OsmC
MKIEKILYRGEATATGGREGKATSSTNSYSLLLNTPTEMGGGGGDGTNPEQMFAGGYSACFLGAMRYVAGLQKTPLPADTSIHGIVGIGQIPGGFGLEVELQIKVPGMDKASAQAIVDQAHTVCPYSNATRGNIEVKLTVL